jgi:hypothetical protein
MIVDVDELLKSSEDYSASSVQQLRYEFDVDVSTQNLRLQRRVESLTWALLLLTVLLAFLTVVLAVDSPTFRRLLGALLE